VSLFPDWSQNLLRTCLQAFDAYMVGSKAVRTATRHVSHLLKKIRCRSAEHVLSDSRPKIHALACISLEFLEGSNTMAVMTTATVNVFPCSG
jgi:hypothetical protein